jgi:hypothetical protein
VLEHLPCTCTAELKPQYCQKKKKKGENALGSLSFFVCLELFSCHKYSLCHLAFNLFKDVFIYVSVSNCKPLNVSIVLSDDSSQPNA